MKKTKRKAFNFLRSYFDVLNELKEDKDKLDFLMAIINKQFLNEDPKELNFLVNLCYESQRHSIESSVKGWLRAANTDILGNPMTITPTPTGTDPSTNPKEEEEKGEEKGEEKEKYPFSDFWDKYPKKIGRKDCYKKWGSINDKDKAKIMETIDDFIKYKPFKDFNLPHPKTYLNQERWNDEIVSKPVQQTEGMVKYKSNVDPTPKYLSEKDFAEKVERDKLGGYIYTRLN